EEEVAAAVQAIFEKNPQGYDHVVLAQEYSSGVKEYRAVVFEKNVVLLYEKDVTGARFTGNLSPLHWEESKAVLIKDQHLIRGIQAFIAPVYDLLDLCYG